MKSFKTYITEEMSPEEFQANAQKAINEFDPILKAMFPDFTASVGWNKGFGGVSSLSVKVVSPWKVTEHNAKLRAITMMHLTNNFGRIEPMSKFALENLTIPKKFKYRKISAKTPYEAIKKMVAWLKKNKEALIEQGNSDTFI